MDTKKNIQTYLDELSSNSPTPGGGNVAAFCGSLASSLGEMVCNLTLGKKKYADVAQEIISLQKQLTILKDNFLALAILDNEAFDSVMSAYKLPKETDEEKHIRSEAIERATFKAAYVPSEVIRNCSLALPVLTRITEIGNKNSLSDAGVSLLLIRASAEGAYLNVLINCSSLTQVQVIFDLLEAASKNIEVIKSIVGGKISEITDGLKNH